VFVCIQGHCREFKVIHAGGHSAIFSIERETGAVILDSEIDRQSMTVFDVFDVAANCSTSDYDNSSTVIHTQVFAFDHDKYYTL